jgi:protoporphyrinogen oxidase
MNIVLGGGLAGLAADHRLTEAGRPAVVIEKGARVGGLARTICHACFRFDLGGHRFLTENKRIMGLVAGLLGLRSLNDLRVAMIGMRSLFWLWISEGIFRKSIN